MSAVNTSSEEPTYTDEDFLKTRLLIDGDGTGDDRRLNTLHKLILKFSHMDDDDPEDVKKQYERIMTLLATCQWVDQRTKLVQAMNKTEMSKCDKVYDQISHAIAEAQLNIEHERDDLIQARKIRKNRMEYDALAKEICKNPDRNTTGKKLEEIQAEINTLRLMEDALDEKLEMRKKQFHVLVHSIHELQRLLDVDNEDYLAPVMESKTKADILNTSNVSSNDESSPMEAS
ncbi:hypothetical protein TCAL_10038 [Tigriopus californicus]|uniref:THO complex subunit 7 homolog n=1 Tax=Tigriopus californicus TaxID=6832 RepID=A0A553PR15_TIGCA|nr:THO complex subunit 7 homolog [Tigriopus californicus]TRY80128.1 hypothetical protein TCAL_10038 [Tigriopus californicus]|eukprot:TCALIF_10038-PA protein Name:"Similar to Thoc7 THO complex subunit 7 homolog (Mus musculus)" AED:0.01 eAED:0.01 QI:88/1/1/1/0.5/0.66/3/98/230